MFLMLSFKYSHKLSEVTRVTQSAFKAVVERVERLDEWQKVLLEVVCWRDLEVLCLRDTGSQGHSINMLSFL
jgi:hypothetical protein